MAADLLEQAARQRQPWLLLSGIENLQADNDDPYEDLMIRAEQMRVFYHAQNRIGWGQEAELHLIARLFRINIVVRRHLQEEGGLRIVHTEFARFLPFAMDQEIDFVSSCFRPRLRKSLITAFQGAAPFADAPTAILDIIQRDVHFQVAREITYNGDVIRKSIASANNF